MTKKKILIVENDKALQETLVNSLSPFFECSVAASIREVELQFGRFRYDLVILDRMLNDGDAVELVGSINEISFNTRVIFLSQKSSTPDKINGLDAGADDYLAKPFSLSELKLRINKLLNSVKISVEKPIRVGRLEIDYGQGLIRFDTKNYQLRKKEVKILTCLGLYQNQTVSRKNIIAHAWSGTSSLPQQSTLDVYIRRIRTRIPPIKPYLRSIRGFGYSLNSV
jgi:DNA-binding response OmpR family regulator